MYSVSESSVPFLDVRVILKDGKLHSDLYIKPTDKFQYLDFTSCHPHHQKANLPYALALRIRRICLIQRISKIIVTNWHNVFVVVAIKWDSSKMESEKPLQ